MDLFFRNRFASITIEKCFSDEQNSQVLDEKIYENSAFNDTVERGNVKSFQHIQHIQQLLEFKKMQKR